MQGKIIRGVGGLYFVYVPRQGVYECKARGIFRKDNVKPLVGDNVEIEALPEPGKGLITAIMPRRSALIRPAVANVDQALIIFAIASPAPSFNLLDRFLIMIRQQSLPCVICFNKMDMDREGKASDFCRAYENSGCRILTVSAKDGEGIDRLRDVLWGRTTAVAGPSGVGKSSLINCLQTEVVMATGEVSKKIERGRHTTRHTELITLSEDTFILDTPGFSSLELFDLQKEELADFYPEFTPYASGCRFTGCSHIAEPDCSVKIALDQGKISPLRYENYCLLYQELKERRSYDTKARK